MTKYVICKPRGGFIDIISIISDGLKYAEKFNRTLVIDTNNSLHFKDGFSKYFNFTTKFVFEGDIDQLYLSLKNNKTDGDIIIDYKTFDPFNGAPRYKLAKPNLTEDSDKDVILIGYYNLHLNRDILYFFKNFTINNLISANFIKRYNSLPKEYISIHVRNTDYKSNTNKFIDDNHSKFIDKNIFLGSDDVETITVFKKKYEGKLFSFSKIDKPTFRGIHFIKRTIDDHIKFNIDTLCDFLILSAGSNYYFSCKQSGFSNCINVMFNDKTTIRKIIKDAQDNFSLCKTQHCVFKIHTNIKNNGGTHCCLGCKIKGLHGRKCERLIN